MPKAQAYTSTKTTWDFSKVAPALSGKNRPVISGTALVDPELCELQFASGTTGAGYLTIDFDEPIKSDVEIEFYTTGHSKPLGMQSLYFSISNSEQKEIIHLQAHPYSYEIVTDDKGNQTDYTGKNKLLICDEVKAEEKEVYDLFATKNQKTTHIKVNIDYTARKVTAVFDNKTTFTGDIPAKILGDIGQFKFWSEKSKTAADRYITLDNLSVKEYKSTETPAGDESLKAYTSATYGSVTSRVKAPTDSTDKPLVVFLSSKSRFGTDNEGQLYQAQYFFDKLADNAILSAISDNAIRTMRDMLLRPEVYRQTEENLRLLLADILAEVQNGKDVDETRKQAHTKIYQSINSSYTPPAPRTDFCYADTPAVYMAVYTVTNKLLIEARLVYLQK